ncbi:hypothetical protein [Chromobacterium violaceum]|uniref:hypothetical protein n=1 Tax=Chromobacterium violaceum TaxID=536 RepID=UPI001C8CD727|nr:hypothetical protein [Chromobacterium violaceum]MBX9267248.1 hypothetical protein [Chromobacterium violaceum]
MTTDALPVVSLEIDANQAPTIYTGKGLDVYFEHIKAMVNEVPDLSTKKGRDRIASLAYKVSQSKTAVEKPGRDYLKLVKELPKKIEEELRDFVTKCDALRDAVRQPLTDWEAEQERLAAEKKAADEAAALARQIEADHEIALLMNREHDRLAEEKRQTELRAQQEREAEIARQAEEKARQEGELKAWAERQAAIQREIGAKLAAERAEMERQAAEQRAKDAEDRAERERVEADKRARLAAIKAEEERVKAAGEAAAAERRRLEQEAEAKATEERRRAADTAHRAKVNREALDDLMATGLTEDQAKAVVCAIVKQQVRHVAIQY